MANYLNKKSIEDIDVCGKRVLVRCDFNVPLKDGKITDDNRIIASLPTIEYLLEKGARVILCSHLGRPKTGSFEAEFSVAPVAKRLSELLGFEVKLAADVVGESAGALAAEVESGKAILLENVRFEKGETKNDESLSKAFASLADIFVNDAFGTAHRAHSSTAGVAAYLPAVCGYLIQKEITVLGTAVSNPKRPFVAILGGSKVADKISVITNLLDKVDTLIIGGGMAYTFMAAQGKKIGASLFEADYLDTAKDMLKTAKENGIRMLIPTDSVIADKFSNDANVKYVYGDIPDDWMGLDIGVETIKIFTDAVKSAGTVIWNGPLGVFEMDKFAIGTTEMAKALAESSAVSIIGGGDSAAAAAKFGLADKMTHISTGGGATLEFLEGKEIPGVAVLDERE